MNVYVMKGSPRPAGNTNSLLRPFVQTLEQLGHTVAADDLYGKNVAPCLSCCGCQEDWTNYACVQHDDMDGIAENIMEADLIVLASPIYCWYCTAPMKLVLDRIPYGFCKYYGEERGPSLLEGKGFCLVTTCGFPPEQGADMWAEGMRRNCRHWKSRYLGQLAEQHKGYEVPFMTPEKENRARAFARSVAGQMAEA